MTGIVAHTYPEWWLKLTGQAAHWSTDYSENPRAIVVAGKVNRIWYEEACLKAGTH